MLCVKSRMQGTDDVLLEVSSRLGVGLDEADSPESALRSYLSVTVIVLNCFCALVQFSGSECFLHVFYISSP